MSDVTPASDWRKGTTEIHTYRTGKVAELQRPGPDLFLKFGQLPTHMLVAWQKAGEGKDLGTSGMEFLGKMSDEDSKAFLLFARDVVLACFKRPRIVIDRTPEGDDEIAPEHLTFSEFWETFMWGAGALMSAGVNTEGGKVTAGAVEKFRNKPGVSSSRSHGKVRRGAHVGSNGAA